MVISIRVSDEERDIITHYAKQNDMSISELMRSVVMEHIEDEYDYQAYLEAKAEFDANPVTYTHEEVGRMLGLL